MIHKHVHRKGVHRRGARREATFTLCITRRRRLPETAQTNVEIGARYSSITTTISDPLCVLLTVNKQRAPSSRFFCSSVALLSRKSPFAARMMDHPSSISRANSRRDTLPRSFTAEKLSLQADFNRLLCLSRVHLFADDVPVYYDASCDRFYPLPCFILHYFVAADAQSRRKCF